MPPWVWVIASGILHTNIIKFFFKPSCFSGHKEGSKPCHTMRIKKTGLSRPGVKVQVHGSPLLHSALASDVETHTLQCLEFSCLFNAYSQRVPTVSSRWLRLRELKSLLYLWPLPVIIELVKENKQAHKQTSKQLTKQTWECRRNVNLNSD